MNLSHCHEFEAIEEMHILFSLEVKFLWTKGLHGLGLDSVLGLIMKSLFSLLIAHLPNSQSF